jgi:hypothetical protein
MGNEEAARHHLYPFPGRRPVDQEELDRAVARHPAARDLGKVATPEQVQAPSSPEDPQPPLD